MRIKIARKAGFCMGVRRAVNLVLKALNSGQTPLYTYGPLIHNPQTLELLSQLGVKPLKRIDEDVPKGFCVIRAHGVPPAEKEALLNRHQVIDGTCPRVLKVQALASKAVSSGKEVIIIGDKDHAEVKGILGYCGEKGYVVSSFQDIEKLPPLKSYVILSQTTQDQEVFDLLSEEILSRYPGGEVINTICNATEVRQEEVKRLCKECEAIVVIGGKFSANTKRLAQIAEAEGKKVFLIEKPEELPIEAVKKFNSVGITAGASTPNWLINEVIDYLKNSTSLLYKIFRTFILLNFHEVLLFLLLFSSLFFINSSLLNPRTLFLLPFVFSFQFFRKLLYSYLVKEKFFFYYPLKGNFYILNKNFILFLLIFFFICSIVFGSLFMPRILSLIIVFSLLDFLLLNNFLYPFLDLLFFSSIILYLYPFWNEVFLWFSYHILIILSVWNLYKELLYQQSDGFLPKNFFILNFNFSEKRWFQIYYFLIFLLALPFLILFIKTKYIFYLFFIPYLFLYIFLISLLKRRPLGQILYFEALFLIAPLTFFILCLLFYKL